MKISSALLLFIFAALISCTQKPEADPNYVKQIEQWDKHRVERLKADDGWLNLVGRFWLRHGESTFGSAKNNDIVFESSKLPEHIGSFIFVDTVVTFKAKDGVNVLHNGEPVKEIVMIDDQKKDMTVLQIGTIKFNLIVRNTLYGIRARDLNSELVLC